MTPSSSTTGARARSQTFVPTDPSGRVGRFVCGPTVNELPHHRTPRPTTSLTSSSASRGPVASPSGRCRTSPTWSRARAPDRPVRRRSQIRARVSGRHTCAAQRLRGRVRAPQRQHRPRHQPDRAPAAGGGATPSGPRGPRGTAMCSCENGAVGSAGSRPRGPSGGPREPRVSGARSSARDAPRSAHIRDVSG
jgi:hypothetical protein